jgi:hypothetical protein
MKTLLAFAVFVGFALAATGPSSALHRNAGQAIQARYTNTTCHQKIDPKNLKGPALKGAWYKCRENPDAYN